MYWFARATYVLDYLKNNAIETPDGNRILVRKIIVQKIIFKIGIVE